MSITLRPAISSELDALHDLCMRSKAYWGYDEAFMKACTEELRINKSDLENHHVVVAEEGSQVLGVTQLEITDKNAELDKLFICPDAIGRGVGRQLFNWVKETSRAAGARKITIHADPYAEDFYNYMGAKTTRTVPSGSIEGRVLPFMEYVIKS